MPELPIDQHLSFEGVFGYLEQEAKDEKSPIHASAKKALEEYKDLPILREGFNDFSKLEEYKSEIDHLLNFIFPTALGGNEIKAVSVPFDFTTFKFSKRFRNILDNAGEDYRLDIRNMEDSSMYIMACTFILSFWYGMQIDFKRPFFFDIPDKKTGRIRNYRVVFNGDFMEIIKKDSAPEVTEEDIKMLIDNFDQPDHLELWKEKFPPGSYILKGFGILNLFDVTTDETLSDLKQNLLSMGDDAFERVEKNIVQLFGLPDVKFGFSTYFKSEDRLEAPKPGTGRSYIIHEDMLNCTDTMCMGVQQKVMDDCDILTISDIERYGEQAGKNGLYHSLKANKIESFILVPIQVSEDIICIMELVSTNKYDLNGLNANKLKDVIPVFTIAIQQAFESYFTKLESIIQENYTSIHPSVKWRFYEAAEKYMSYEALKEIPRMDDIVFNKVFPLYGQCDIKGSSTARNSAIQADLTHQLSIAIDVMQKALKYEKLPIYNELIYRLEELGRSVKKGLKTGDEVGITDFFKRDIYPVFKHLKSYNPDLNDAVANYMDQIDDNLHVIYNKRKDYEDSVTLINESLAHYLDQKQEEAQEMFPHYFERFKTDGVEFNMYIGQSLVQNREFEDLYLYNLRLWQLQQICQMEQIAYNLTEELPYPLRVASLILVHSNDLSIKFRMDEKQFDVDGAYNIRYEILKKRIDKAFIKGTKERITQPGKICIVYSQEKDAREYERYIQYLQSMNYLHGGIEHLNLEDLQGISGLKALRVELNYQQDSEAMSMGEIVQLIQENDAGLSS